MEKIVAKCNQATENIICLSCGKKYSSYDECEQFDFGRGMQYICKICTGLRFMPIKNNLE